MKLPAGVLVAIVAFGASEAPALKPSRPLDAIPAIVDAFRTHHIVALGEPHGNEQAAAFRLALLRDRRFLGAVNDIVIESGNSRLQDIIDRFVNGADVSERLVQQAWQDTTVAGFVWDRPIYAQLFDAVREVNRSLPQPRRIRLLLGDPPIDWATTHTSDDLLKWLVQRDAFAASLIREQVLATGHRALVIFGEGHFWRHNAGNNLVARLEALHTSVFTISTPIQTDLAHFQADVNTWPTPSLTLLSGTAIGSMNFDNVFPGTGSNEPPVRYEDQADAALYLGPPSKMTTSMLPASLCGDQAYVAMRVARMELDPGPPGSAPPRERLARNCSAR